MDRPLELVQFDSGGLEVLQQKSIIKIKEGTLKYNKNINFCSFSFKGGDFCNYLPTFSFCSFFSLFWKSLLKISSANLFWKSLLKISSLFRIFSFYYFLLLFNFLWIVVLLCDCLIWLCIYLFLHTYTQLIYTLLMYEHKTHMCILFSSFIVWKTCITMYYMVMYYSLLKMSFWKCDLVNGNVFHVSHGLCLHDSLCSYEIYVYMNKKRY